MSRLLFTLLFLSSFLFSQAQDSSPWSYGVNPYYGAVLKYKEEMKQLEFTDLHGVELYAAKESDGTKSWHKLYNYPQWGIAASYFNYGVPDELGWVTSLTTYLDLTAGKKKHKWRLNIGTGAVYSSVTFKPETNEDNKAVSSTISYVMRGTIHKEFKLSDQYYLNVNLAFRHYSNGRLNMPNNGMNYPIVGVGFRYLPQPINLKNDEQINDGFNSKTRFTMRASMSWRQVWQVDDYHKAYSLSFYGSREVSKFNSLLLGIDGFSYEQESVIRANTVYRDKEGVGPEVILDDGTEQLAVTFGTELHISKVSVIVQAGVYVYKPQAYYSSWYQRYGVKYNFNRYTFGQFSLKSHSRTADMIEFGVGFTI